MAFIQSYRSRHFARLIIMEYNYKTDVQNPLSKACFSLPQQALPKKGRNFIKQLPIFFQNSPSFLK